LGGTAYEAAIALEWISIGEVPGEGAPGEGEVLSVSVLAVLTGIAVSIFSSRGNRLVAGLAPAAAALMVARFYSFDPYFAPSLRRASEGGLVAAAWVYSLVALALLAGALALSRPRLAFIGAPIMFLCVFTTLFAFAGH
jgi:hypothetical protein